MSTPSHFSLLVVDDEPDLRTPGDPTRHEFNVVMRRRALSYAEEPIPT